MKYILLCFCIWCSYIIQKPKIPILLPPQKGDEDDMKCTAVFFFFFSFCYYKPWYVRGASCTFPGQIQMHEVIEVISAHCANP